MGLKKCQIYFDNSYGTYFAGQTITGRVELVLDAPKKVRAIRIQFRGAAETSWTESVEETDDKGNNQTNTVSYGTTEEYFVVKYNLVDGGADGSTEIPAGSHTYTFTCALPPSLPSSFEGEFGHVRYTTKVILDRPWKFDQETKAALTVLSNVDLNVLPRCREPANISVDKYFCCCWCRSGPLTVVLAIPCTGYVPGQSIPITLELDNVSDVSVTSVAVSVVKIVSFYSSSRSDNRKSINTIVQYNFNGVEGRSSVTYNEQLVLPALPPSNLANCSIIDLDYELKIEAIVTGPHHNINGRIPLVIGTIPLANVPTINLQTQKAQANAPPLAEMTAAGGDATTPLLGWNLPSNISPPSYEQSMFGTKSIQDNSDNEYTIYSNNNPNFSPMYPVYRPSA